MERMSMRPEPSVLDEPEGARTPAEWDGTARASRFESEKSTEFSLRCPVRWVPPAPFPGFLTTTCSGACAGDPPNKNAEEGAAAGAAWTGAEWACATWAGAAAATAMRPAEPEGVTTVGAAKTSSSPAAIALEDGASAAGTAAFMPALLRAGVCAAGLAGACCGTFAKTAASSGTVERAVQSPIPSFQTKVSELILPWLRRSLTPPSVSGPTCSPSTTTCHTPCSAATALDDSTATGAGAAVEAGAAAASPPTFTTMTWLHFLQRILNALPWILSSAIEYLAWQASQTIFMGSSFRRTSKGGWPGDYR